MKKTPLKEIKDLQNEILRREKMVDLDVMKVASFSQFLIIQCLFENREENREVYQKDLESILNIRKSTLSGILDTMEKNKIITRVQNGESKGNIISLNNSVLDAHDEILKNILYLEEKIIRGIDENDLKTFYRVIDTMKENLIKED